MYVTDQLTNKHWMSQVEALVCRQVWYGTQTVHSQVTGLDAGLYVGSYDRQLHSYFYYIKRQLYLSDL